LFVDGMVDLDATVQRCIPWFRVGDSTASAKITVRHLLTMTSGIPVPVTLAYKRAELPAGYLISTAEDMCRISSNVDVVGWYRMRS